MLKDIHICIGSPFLLLITHVHITQKVSTQLKCPKAAIPHQLIYVAVKRKLDPLKTKNLKVGFLTFHQLEALAHLSHSLC